jgi:uncharacterized protein (TIGR02996 family)
MHTEADLLAAIEADPADDLAWLALADCLEEHGQDVRAELVRLREWLRHAPLEHRQRGKQEKRLAGLLEGGVRPSVPTRLVRLGKGVRLPMTLLPPGAFWMGSPDHEKRRWNDEGPRHRVVLTRPFYISTTSVTAAQWRAAARSPHDKGTGDDHPVTNVSWDDAQAWCARLSRKTERTFRLPTEAEWEYACRAATTKPYYLGRSKKVLDRCCWSDDNAGGRTQPVAMRTPNAWGLHDMLGNVWNWCDDGYRKFTAKEVRDPRGTDEGRHGVRGGSWRSAWFRCRCAARYPYENDFRLDDLGIRVVMEWAG